MEYKDFRIEHTGCTVVYGGTKEERDTFEKIFLSQNPSYRLQVLPCLQTVKKGLFGKKKTLLETLLGEVPKSEKKAMENRLMEQSNTLAIRPMLYYSAEQLSYVQKLLWSYVFEIAAGRRVFLFRDDAGPFNDVDICELVSYLQIHTGMTNSSFVWITARKIPDFLETIVPDASVAIYSDELFRKYIRNASLMNKCHHLYRLQFGSICQEDKDALHQELKAQAQAEWDAMQNDAMPSLQEAEKLEQKGQFTDALIIYKKLMKAQIPDAFFFAGKILCEQPVNDTTLGNGMSLILSAANEYAYAPANIYLGNRNMEEFKNRIKDNAHSDSPFAVQAIKRAEKNYALAARQGSAEGAYLAAKLHLSYSSTENYGGDISQDIGKENAIPYMHQLMHMQKNEDSTADLYLTMLKMKNKEIYQAAETSYKP